MYGEREKREEKLGRGKKGLSCRLLSSVYLRLDSFVGFSKLFACWEMEQLSSGY